MRVLAIVTAISLNACSQHAAAIATETSTAATSCFAGEPCWSGGTGAADHIVSVAVVGAIVGLVGFEVYRRFAR